VFAGAPVRLLARLPAAGDGRLQLRARGPEGAWAFDVDLPAGGARDDLARLYAREAVADHEVARAAGDLGRDAAIEALGVRFQISTRLTSFVAVAERSTAAPLDGALPALRVPHELPAGMSLAGLGLVPAPAMLGGGGPQPKLAAPAPAGPLMARARRAEAMAPPPPMAPSMQAPEPIFAELEESASASLDDGRAPGFAPPEPAPAPAREQAKRAKRAEPGLIGALRRALRRLIGGAEVEVIDGVTHLWLTAADPLDALILHLVLADGSTRAPTDLAVERLPDGRWWIHFVHDADAVALRTATTELARWG
jgi:Ca-activated chloride channel family protein